MFVFYSNIIAVKATYLYLCEKLSRYDYKIHC